MLDARRRRRGKQNPPASVAQTGTPRSSSRPESSPGIRSEIVPLPPQAPFAAAGCGRPHGHYTTYGTTWDSGISLLARPSLGLAVALRWYLMTLRQRTARSRLYENMA